MHRAQSAGQRGDAAPLRVSNCALAGALVGMFVLGAVAWLVYLSVAWSGCHGGDFVMFNVKTGGAASGEACTWLHSSGCSCG
jgi:hypothetical protein